MTDDFSLSGSLFGGGYRKLCGTHVEPISKLLGFGILRRSTAYIHVGVRLVILADFETGTNYLRFFFRLSFRPFNSVSLSSVVITTGSPPSSLVRRTTGLLVRVSTS